MMSSKATSVVSCPAFDAGCFGGDPQFLLFSATAPSLSALLGLYAAEAEPSEATSATRYDCFEGVWIVPMVMPEFKFIDVQRQVGGADLVEAADDTALNQRPEAFDVLSVN